VGVIWAIISHLRGEGGISLVRGWPNGHGESGKKVSKIERKIEKHGPFLKMHNDWVRM
jgi:hypothetical protein